MVDLAQKLQSIEQIISEIELFISSLSKLNMTNKEEVKKKLENKKINTSNLFFWLFLAEFKRFNQGDIELIRVLVRYGIRQKDVIVKIIMSMTLTEFIDILLKNKLYSKRGFEEILTEKKKSVLLRTMSRFNISRDQLVHMFPLGTLFI